MALPPRCDPVTHVIRRASLSADWHEVGRGGFGRVYKARHKDMGIDVAVKILKKDASHILLREARFMDLGSNEFVLRVYGIYEGPSGERGLVTEYMRRGSIESLQKQLSGPPPWPLAFRLVHQIALAMNFLHLKNIVHLDLKPNNILLDDTLNAKVADFGLSTVSMSVEMNCRNMQTGPQGTFPYMPPEAFKTTYEPVRAFDTYSYGILIWSIFTGKEPYQGVNYTLVELRIPEGDRPLCEDLLSLQVVGITDAVGLMKKCWDQNPDMRPHFKDCFKITEQLFSKHSKDIQRTVYEVLTILASSSVSGKTMTRREKAKFVDDHRAVLIQRVSNALVIAEELEDMVHNETYSLIQVKETSQAKIRELYSATLRSGGERAKAAFYDALKKHQPVLMEELEK
ncbi:receptor-interacting serine/threonine-protein kinase 4-like [Eucyclogobius newberryi]|uniref:receptor-interacting serine/threonine-protein kinase 4-like n=1 Tax=Eucyclogobius newberryi TaxID=166745 RepID=UPI003B59E9F2